MDKEKEMTEEEIEKPSIDDRIKELEADGKSKTDMVLILYQEGYSTHEIMKRKLPLKALKRAKERKETGVLGAIEGAVKGAGYLDELKDMIRMQIGKTRELTEEFYNLGLGVLFASLAKSGMNMEDFRKIAMQEGTLRDAFKKAGETAFKALEYYQSDLITRVEKERDESRAYASMIEAQVDELAKSVDPKLRFERMIQTYLFGGKVDPEILLTMIDKWLAMEATELKMGALLA